MANLLSNTTVGGSAVITTSNIGSYAITSLSGYATQSWVQSQGYLTSVPAQSWASITSKPFLLTLNYDQGSPWAGNTGGSGRNLVASFHGASGNSVITFGSGNGDLNLSVDGNVYVNEGQDILASRTWVSTSGNAATATTFSSNRTNYKNNTDNAVAGQLMWKAYGNNHTIFDASASTAPDGTSVNNTNSAVAWTGTYPTLMGWNGSTTYGVRVDSARIADSASAAPWSGITGKPSGSTGLVQYGDFVNQSTFSGKTVTFHPSVIKTLLWGGNGTRYTVADTYTGTFPQAGSTWIRTYELIDGSNSVYSSGNIYLGFWNNYPPSNITVRVQNTSGTWYGPYSGSNIGVGGTFEYWKIPCGGPNFIKKWEITFIPQAGLGINLQSVDIVIDNSEGIDQSPFVGRGGSSMLGDLTLSGGATLNLTGSANKYLNINPGNGYEAMVRYIGGSGSSWYVGKRITNQLVGTESFHFYSEAAGQTVAGIDTSGNSYAIGSFRAPVFYDSNDTNYYGNFNGTSVMSAIRFGTSTNNGTLSGAGDWGMRLSTDAGYIQFGPANGSYAHIYTDRATFYFNKDLLVNGSTVITAGTIGSQSVSYASTAGSASSSPYLSALGDYVFSASTNGRDFSRGIQTSFVSTSEGYPEYGSVVRIRTYTGSNDGGTAELYFPYSSTYGGTSMRYRLGQYSNAGWTGWKTVIDSDNISSQSVSYATTAGALSSMNISQFSNNSGYLTGITSGQVTGALGYTPYNSSNPSGYITSSGSISGTAGSISGFNNPTTAATGNTIAYRTADGDLAVRELILNVAVQSFTPSSMVAIYPTTNQAVKVNAAGVQAFLGLGSLAYSSATIPTNNNQLTNGAGYITGYTETDTLNSVTTRGASTTNDITIGGLTVSGSLTYGTFPSASNYVTGADNIVLKGNSSGVSGIFFESEKNGTNINHPSDFGFIQYHAYGIGGSSGESNRLVIGISNDADDIIVLNPVTSNGLVVRVGAGTTEYVVYHSGNIPTWNQNTTGSAGSLSSMNISQFTNNSGYITGINSGNVTTALGFTPYNSTNPNGYVTSSGSVNYATTAGSAPNGSNVNSNYDVAVGDGNGLRFWGGSDSYKISMGVGALYQYGPVTDYSIKAQMNDSSTARGFTWGRISYAPIAALNSTSGDMEIAGYMKSYGYRGNGNVGGTGTASWHPDGIYCGSTMWQYGSQYKNGSSIYDVGELKMYSGPYLQVYNSRNLIVKSADNADAGILGRGSSNQFAFQLYGGGNGDYGFLDGAWANWDIRKTVDGAMYMNDNNSYYLYTNSTSNFYALNIQGNAVVHAGNIGSQTVSAANYLTASNYIIQRGSNGSWNNDFTSTPAGTMSYAGDLGANTTNGPGGTWWIQQNFRHTNSSNHWGTQVAWGWEDNANRLATRNITGGNFGSWVYYLNSSNFTSYAPSLTGSGASGTWGINVTGSAGSVAWTNVSSRPTALSQFTNDLGNYGGFLTSITAHTHAISDVTGLQTALDGKQASLGFTPYNATNPSGYITSSASISGNAATATNVAWTGVTGRPTALSQFSNDLGNYGGFLTSLPAHDHDRVFLTDSRGAVREPSYYDDRYAQWDFQNNGDTNAGGDAWHGLLTVSKWTVYDGSHRQEQLAFTGDDLKRRTAASDSAWGPWKTILDSNNFSTWAAAASHTHSIANVTGLQTALDGKQASGSYLTTSGKAADSELFDGTDSIYFVKGNGVNTLGYRTTGNSGANSAGGLSSGFYDGSGMSNMPTSDWYHLIVNAHNNSSTSNQYEFHIATPFWDKSNFYVRSISPGDVGPWRTLIHNGNIGSQSVSYASTAGSASTATTATTATVASQLNKFGDIYGQDWNTYYVQDKLIAAAVYGHSGANRPNLTYDYGVALSYGEATGPRMQMYFPENSPNLGTIFRKATYRTGWNGNWSTWKTLVEQEGNTCTIVGGNGTGLEVHGNVGYNQDPLTYFLLRGQADTSWKAFKVRLTGDAGGQDIEFRRIAENGADSRMWYVPRGGNTVNFEYPIVQPSDSRLKDNITPISTPVEKIKALSGVEFDWNSGEQVGTHDVGLIAQDVEAVLPEAVTTQEDGYKNLSYTKVIPLLVEAMKEQQTMIEALRAEIELLKNK